MPVSDATSSIPLPPGPPSAPPAPPAPTVTPSRGALLSAIQGASVKALKKTVTVDRSAPAIENPSKSPGASSASSSAGNQVATASASVPAPTGFSAELANRLRKKPLPAVPQTPTSVPVAKPAAVVLSLPTSGGNAGFSPELLQQAYNRPLPPPPARRTPVATNGHQCPPAPKPRQAAESTVRAIPISGRAPFIVRSAVPQPQPAPTRLTIDQVQQAWQAGKNEIVVLPIGGPQELVLCKFFTGLSHCEKPAGASSEKELQEKVRLWTNIVTSLKKGELPQDKKEQIDLGTLMWESLHTGVSKKKPRPLIIESILGRQQTSLTLPQAVTLIAEKYLEGKKQALAKKSESYCVVM